MLSKFKGRRLTEPPPFAPDLKPEDAIIWRYDVLTQSWKLSQPTTIVIDRNTFAEGRVRYAFRARFDHPPSSLFAPKNDFVAKMPKHHNEAAAQQMKDEIVMQMEALVYAARYNARAPPALVAFVEPFLAQLTSRPGSPFVALEPFLLGEYRKYNNNWDFVEEKTPDAPQAFSHFTYDASDNSLIVIDIQGVGLVFTDPQIHTVDGVGYGSGNLGRDGIAAFFSKHACNSTCTALNLSRHPVAASHGSATASSPPASLPVLAPVPCSPTPARSSAVPPIRPSSDSAHVLSSSPRSSASVPSLLARSSLVDSSPPSPSNQRLSQSTPSADPVPIAHSPGRAADLGHSSSLSMSPKAVPTRRAPPAPGAGGHARTQSLADYKSMLPPPPSTLLLSADGVSTSSDLPLSARDDGRGAPARSGPAFSSPVPTRRPPPPPPPAALPSASPDAVDAPASQSAQTLSSSPAIAVRPMSATLSQPVLARRNTLNAAPSALTPAPHAVPQRVVDVATLPPPKR